MSNISYVVIPTKGSVRVLYKKHWKPGVTVSSLLIDRVNYTHSGIFWCMPSNSANKSVHVHVLKGKANSSKFCSFVLHNTIVVIGFVIISSFYVLMVN